MRALSAENRSASRTDAPMRVPDHANDTFLGADTRGFQVEQELTLRIVLEKPPGGIDFGVQKGKGSTREFWRRTFPEQAETLARHAQQLSPSMAGKRFEDSQNRSAWPY